MPRAEGIAWKFVIRQGKKWRCPYCKKEYSGSVTRVKSHFCKQPKEGIVSCTKVPQHISMLMELLQNQVDNKDDIAWKFVDRLGENIWHCHHCKEEFLGDLAGVKGHLLGVPTERIPICTEVPDHIITLMRSLLGEVAEEESRGANGQSSMEPQSCDTPTQPSPVLTPENLEYVRTLLSTPRGASHMANFTPQGVIGLNSDQQSQVEHQLRQSSAMPLFVQSSHVQPALVSPQHQSVLHQSINHEIRDTQQNGTIPLDNLDTTRQPDLHDSPPENLVESRDVIVNALEATPTPNSSFAVGDLTSFMESLEADSFMESLEANSFMESLDADSLNCELLDNIFQNELQESLLPDPFASDTQLSNMATTNTPQQSSQPLQIDTEWGHGTGRQPPIPSLPSTGPLTAESVDPLQIPEGVTNPIGPWTSEEAATDAMGPSSSQDMNRGSAIMDVWSNYANDEEMRNLKRKVEELDDKEAVIKEQMEMESAASSVRKKPRILVERWLKETERARNNFQIIGQANAETLSPKEQVETLTREVEELMGKTLPQTLLIEERDAKGVKKLTGEAIHGNIELIWDLLTKNHGCKLGIYGMGGVGKTAIMMHIRNRLLDDATFDGVAFITVSKDFSIYKLQRDIGKALKWHSMEDDYEYEDEKKRAAMLSEHLERKKNCVLILDDVWEHLDLEEVGIPIRAHGFKFVLTTRSFDVCCQMQCQEKIKIEPLSQEEAESLFLEELGPEMPLNLEIEAIVKSIVKECAGLPIGVITMARSMRGVTDAFQWRDFLTKLKESSMGQTNTEMKLPMNLKVSYDRLGNPDVQQCFLSCALYPEDELIDKYELIEFFIDQGLIGRLNTRKEQYDRGLGILKMLGNVCLLEDHGGEVKMHDLLRDMALHIMSATSMVKARKGWKRIPPEEYWTDALEKVSLMKNNISEFPLNLSPNCPKLSILLLDYGLCDAVIPDSFFKNLCGLKVLNLSGHNMRELPNSISDLVNLRALLLRDCKKLCRIPYLGKLTSLRKLDVENCWSLETLEGLEKLANLRYLDLSQTGVKRFPEGTLERLLNLQCLKGLAAEEDITKLGVLETFKCFLKNVDDFNKCVRAIEQSNNPRYYDLVVNPGESWFSVGVSDDTRIGNLRILGREVFIWDHGHAIGRVGGECSSILIPRDVQAMRIRMEKCDGTRNLSSIGPLKDLEELEIYKWENPGVLCGEQVEEVINIHNSLARTPLSLLFPSLRVLKMVGPLKLKYLFGHGSKSNLPHLREIIILECEEMVGIIAAVTSPPPHPLPFFPSLETIYVDYCNKMKRAVESEWMPHFPNLKRIEVRECEEMEELIGGPPPYSPDEQISLESLEVRDCNNMRKLLPLEWLRHLRNLQSIRVYCKGVEILSRAGQGQEGSDSCEQHPIRAAAMFKVM